MKEGDRFRWNFYRPEELSEALFGLAQDRSSWAIELDQSNLRRGLIAVAALESRQGTYTPPSLIVVGDDVSAEVFSWLNVYANEASPLSQFARVILERDWVQFGIDSRLSEGPVDGEDRWASVIVGELLAQLEGSNSGLGSIPLSRAASCFSICAARAWVEYRRADVMRLCVDRMRALEADSRFVRRAISINELTPVWALVRTSFDSPISPIDVANLIVEAASGAANRKMKEAAFTPPRLDEFPDLFGDSVERRVLAFNRLLDDKRFQQKGDGWEFDEVRAVTLAGAAFLVGRGTSHAFLLRRADAIPATALVWFGLMAAFTGPHGWDAEWSRTAKAIEKMLRCTFDWAEPSGPDIYWAEFAWLAETRTGGGAFSGLPKALSNALSVEVVPGASCQLRLVSGPAEARSVGPSVREKELVLALSQFVTLSTKTRYLLEAMASPGQKNLPLESEEPKGPKGAAGRKARRGGNY